MMMVASFETAIRLVSLSMLIVLPPVLELWAVGYCLILMLRLMSLSLGNRIYGRRMTLIQFRVPLLLKNFPVFLIAVFLNLTYRT